ARRTGALARIAHPGEPGEKHRHGAFREAGRTAVDVVRAMEDPSGHGLVAAPYEASPGAVLFAARHRPADHRDRPDAGLRLHLDAFGRRHGGVRREGRIRTR